MITAVVPTSPIPSHPETAILEETFNSIRHHLPDAEIILTFDGVRSEQDERRGDYEEYVRRALWLADKQFGNICPIVFDQHAHQTGMMRAALAEIRTPLLLYVEHDTPLVVDEPIAWDAITRFVPRNGLVRFHHEAHIPEEHGHMMHGAVAMAVNSGAESRFVRTSQWSQRPHIATVAFYRRVMATCFTPDSRSFIEDKMHGVCDEAYKIDGMDGWEQYPLWIYSPDTNIKRSYHLDGRAGAEKYEEAQVF